MTGIERDGPGPYIAVIGPGVATTEEEALAAEVGELLARSGAIVVCGGSTGVMEGASRGAAGEGGTVVGILPGLDRAEANPSVTVAIPTGMGEMRNALIARAADALIAVGGEFGTLSSQDFTAGLGVSWYIDLFGRVRRGTERDRALLLATDEGRRGAVLALVSAVATTYVELRTADHQLDIARQTALQHTNDTRVRDLFGHHVEAELPQVVRDERGRLHFAVPQLRMLMNLMPDLDDLRKDAGDGGIQRRVLSEERRRGDRAKHRDDDEGSET